MDGRTNFTINDNLGRSQYADGKFLFCWVAGPEGGLHRIDLKDSSSKRIIKVPGTHSRGQGGIDYEWSPDRKWIAFTKRSSSGSYNIWITPYEGGKETNITKLNALHSNQAWSPDGRYLFFQSDRDGSGLYAVALREEDYRENGDLKFKLKLTKRFINAPACTICDFYRPHISNLKFNKELTRATHAFLYGNKKTFLFEVDNYYLLNPIIDLEFGWMDRKVNHGKFVQRFEEGRVRDSLVFYVNEKWSETVINLGATLPLVNRVNGINNRFAYFKIGSKYFL